MLKMVRIRFLVMTLMVGTILAAGTVIGGTVKADQYDDQINALQQQNAANQKIADSLAAQADSYQAEVNLLQAQINSLQQNIVTTQNQIDDLNRQINEAQIQLDQQKQVLGQNIKTMYLEGDISTLEILASSKDLSDFVNKQEYRNAVSDKVKASVDKINSLKVKLQKQQTEQQNLLKQLESQQSTLQANEDKQNQLLSYTETQKASYTQQIQAANAQIAQLRAEQEAAYERLTGGGTQNFGYWGSFEFRNLTPEYSCGGGYHYCWAGLDQVVNDTWGLGWARECVHYAADRAAYGMNLAPYFTAYAGAGNAWNWPSSLSGAFRVDHSPEAGAVAIVAWPGGGGHAMYVESVLPDGWVHVSQMNWDVQGHYSEMDVKDSGVLFVHFH